MTMFALPGAVATCQRPGAGSLIPTVVSPDVGSAIADACPAGPTDWSGVTWLPSGAISTTSGGAPAPWTTRLAVGAPSGTSNPEACAACPCTAARRPGGTGIPAAKRPVMSWYGNGFGAVSPQR